jgi:hypothetical protein
MEKSCHSTFTLKLSTNNETKIHTEKKIKHTELRMESKKSVVCGIQ